MLINDTTRKEIFAIAGPKNAKGQLTGIRQILIILAKESVIAALQFNEQMLPTQLAIQSIGGDQKFLITFRNHDTETGDVEIRCQNILNKVTSQPVQATVGDGFKRLQQIAQWLSSQKNGRVGAGGPREAACTAGWVDYTRLGLQTTSCVLSAIAPFVSVKDWIKHDIIHAEAEGAAVVGLFTANGGSMLVGCKGATENLEKVKKGECIDEPTFVDFVTACPPSSWMGIIAGLFPPASAVSAFDVGSCAVGMLDFIIGKFRAKARSSGDPHLMSLDGVKYDFQAMGEFVAMKSTTDKFDVQVRYGALGQSSVTFNQAVAVHTGADVISYELSKSYLFVNQQKVDLSQLTGKSYSLPGGGGIIGSKSGVLITTPNNDQFFCQPGNLEFSPADNRKGKLVGLFGNFDENMSNDGRTRDNKVVNLLRPDHLYPTYADSWRITQAESLFFYENGATTETYTDRTKPNNKRPFNSLSLAERQQAEAICRQAGVTREPELSNCILDVAITGDAAYATLASVAAKANPTDNNFLPLADYPGKSAEGDVGVTAGDKIYAGLGKTSVDWAMYDPAVDKWTTKTPFPGGKTAYVRMGTFAINNKIYCVGGAIDNKATNALWEYDTQTDAWTRRKDLPGVARYNIASFATGGKGYALFGATGWGLGESDYPTKSALYEYDPTTDNWTQKADFPDKPRGNNITSAEFNGLVIVINGRPFVGGGTGSGRVWDDWYEYIPARNSWEKRAKAYGGTYYCAIGNVAYTLFNRYQMSYDATTDTWSKYPGKEIYLPLSTNMIRGLYQLPVLNGKAYLGLGIGTNNVSNKEWWSFAP